jgi:hypothetical protein
MVILEQLLAIPQGGKEETEEFERLTESLKGLAAR